MNKYKTFIFFIILTALWSCIFSSIKYFFWGDLQSGIAPDLQVLSGYLSFGGIIAYLIGGAVAYTFLKKYLLFALALLTLVLVGLAYIFPITQSISLSIVVGGIGLFYGLWVVLRSILVSIEIQKTGMDDTKVNGIISIIFIIFLILGTILGSKLFELYGHNGMIFIMAGLVAACIISLFLDYDNKSLKSLFINGFSSYKTEKTHTFSKAIKKFVPEGIYIFKNYSVVLFLSSIIWAVSTVVSQKAVEFSVVSFEKLPSEAAILLLYSSVGAILGNVVSGFMSKYRWKAIFGFNILLGIFIICFPFFSSSFFQIGVLAFGVGVAFGTSTNLIDAYYLSEIGKINKKEYGSATLGLVFSTLLFIIMFIASFIDKQFGFEILMWILGGMVLVVNMLNLKKILGK